MEKKSICLPIPTVYTNFTNIDGLKRVTAEKRTAFLNKCKYIFKPAGEFFCLLFVRLGREDSSFTMDEKRKPYRPFPFHHCLLDFTSYSVLIPPKVSAFLETSGDIWIEQIQNLAPTNNQGIPEKYRRILSKQGLAPFSFYFRSSEPYKR